MEETATNVYMPSPLQGLVGPEFGQISGTNPAGTPNKLNPNVIWITGEFFGVQRARDMLFQVSMNKVLPFLALNCSLLSDPHPEQASHLQRFGYLASQARLDGYRTR